MNAYIYPGARVWIGYTTYFTTDLGRMARCRTGTIQSLAFYQDGAPIWWALPDGWGQPVSVAEDWLYPIDEDDVSTMVGADDEVLA